MLAQNQWKFHYHSSYDPTCTQPSSAFFSFSAFYSYFFLSFCHRFSSTSISFYQLLSFPSARPTGSLRTGYFSSFFMSCFLALGISAIQSGNLQPEVLSKFASDLTSGLSSSVNKVMAVPVRSALPVLPTL